MAKQVQHLTPGRVCWLTLLAVVFLALLDAENQLSRLERDEPFMEDVAEILRNAAGMTGGPALNSKEKEWIGLFSGTKTIGEIADDTSEQEDTSGFPGVSDHYDEPQPPAMVTRENTDSSCEEKIIVLPGPTGFLLSPEELKTREPRSAGDAGLERESCVFVSSGNAREVLETLGSRPPGAVSDLPEQVPEWLVDRTVPVSACSEVRPVPQYSGKTVEPPEPPKPVQRKRMAGPWRILLIGDSMMEDFSLVIRYSLIKRKELKFILAGKHSTGLSRPDYYNWPENMKMLMEKEKPDLVVVFIGGNDPMPIREGGKNHYPCSETWKQAYGRRVSEILQIAARDKIRVLWIGLPVMGVKSHAIQIHTINTVQEKVCREAGVPFLDTEPILADSEGKFQSFIKNEQGKIIRLRLKDKEHMTNDGNKMILKDFMPYLEKELIRLKQESCDMGQDDGRDVSSSEPSSSSRKDS